MKRFFFYPTFFISSLFVIFSLATAQVPLRDAVGIRVFKNPEGLSAADWYRDQCKGATKAFLKCGTPTPIIVDGYDGIRDGNTVYVSAANKGSDTKMYTNIYLLAVAEGASSGGSVVFDQLLKNWKFPTATPPLSLDDAAKLRRDVRRRAQLMSLRRLLDSYKATKRCSFTRTELCNDASQCSQGQTCGNYLPNLASGTYIPKVSFSTWPSWQETLGQALGATLPQDSGRPYLLPDPKDSTKQSWQWKNFIGCGNPYDPETCWDARKATMACPLQAYVFAYRYSEQNNNPAYTLTTTYESAAIPDTWQSEMHDPKTWAGTLCAAIAGDTLDADRDADGVPDRVDNCPADYNTDQRDSDRDGLGDVCDTCMFDDRNDIDQDGICANSDTCPFAKDTGRDIDGDGTDDACDSVFCGNSRIDAGEQCDTIGGKGTSVADQYACGAPRSGNDCAWVGGWCGDNAVNGAEQCDARGGAGSSETDQYECGAATPRNAQSCRFVGGWCGDGVKNGTYEPCDVNDETKAGLQKHYICIKTDAGACRVKLLTHCGDGIVQNPNEEKGQEQCERDQQSAQACATTDGYRGAQSRACVDSSCQWGPFGACNPTESCGDGVKNGPEVCDKQASTPANATCKNDCTAWICGAGYRSYNNACELDHCEGPTTQLCAIANGAGTQTRTCNLAAHPPAFNSWGTCAAASCYSGYRVYNNICERDGCDGPTTQSCIIANGQGTQSRSCDAAAHPPAYSNWGTCAITSCDLGFHAEANACVSDTRAACDPLPSSATAGTQTWTGTEWGACAITSCAAGFHQDGNACVSNTRPCDLLPSNATAGTQNWTIINRYGTWLQYESWGWGACIITSCAAGFHQDGNACVSNTRPCSPLPSGATAGTQTWTGTGWGTCSITSCATGFFLNNYPTGFYNTYGICSPYYRCVPARTCPSAGTGWTIYAEQCGTICTVKESRENIPGPTSCVGEKTMPVFGCSTHGCVFNLSCSPPVDCTCSATTY